MEAGQAAPGAPARDVHGRVMQALPMGMPIPALPACRHYAATLADSRARAAKAAARSPAREARRSPADRKPRPGSPGIAASARLGCLEPQGPSGRAALGLFPLGVPAAAPVSTRSMLVRKPDPVQKCGSSSGSADRLPFPPRITKRQWQSHRHCSNCLQIQTE